MSSIKSSLRQYQPRFVGSFQMMLYNMAARRAVRQYTDIMSGYSQPGVKRQKVREPKPGDNVDYFQGKFNFKVSL
jgi:hypothetical protein